MSTSALDGISKQTCKTALALGQKLMNGASEFLEMGKTLAHAEAALSLDQQVLPEGFAKALENHAWAIDAFLAAHKSMKDTLGSESLQGIDALTRGILEAQLKTYTQQLLSLSKWAINIYQGAAQCESDAAEALVPSFAQKVVQYLQSRNGKALLEARLIEEVVSERKHSDSALYITVAKLKNRQVEQESEEVGPMDRLLTFIRPSEGISVALTLLEEAVAEGKTVNDLGHDFDEPLEQIQAAIDKLHAQLGSNRVNFWVWKLAPEPKGGKNFGLVHRYDDLTRLRDAIRNAANEAVEKQIHAQAHEADQDAIFDCLFEEIGSPDVENPKQWIRENACYYLEKVPTAIIQALVLKNRDIIVLTPTPVQPESSFSSSQLEVPVPTTDPTALLLRELEGLAERKDPISSEMMERINGIIIDIDTCAGRSIVNKYVYEFSTDPKKGGPNWGTRHRFDDLAVLHWAITKALSTQPGV